MKKNADRWVNRTTVKCGECGGYDDRTKPVRNCKCSEKGGPK